LPYPRTYDQAGPVRIEPGQNELKVSLGKAHRLTKVRLRLPPRVEVEYRQKAGDGPFFAMHGVHADGDTPGSVEDDGRPVTWTVTAPGYLPVLGSEADWRRVKENGIDYIEITPDLQPGWGALIGAHRRDWDPSIPFHFSRGRGIAGVTIFDANTGTTLGVTHESGYVVITAAQQIQKVGARLGDETKTFDLNGETRFGFGF
jgi:hypothetical protein